MHTHCAHTDTNCWWTYINIYTFSGRDYSYMLCFKKWIKGSAFITYDVSLLTLVREQGHTSTTTLFTCQADIYPVNQSLSNCLRFFNPPFPFPSLFTVVPMLILPNIPFVILSPSCHPPSLIPSSSIPPPFILLPHPYPHPFILSSLPPSSHIIQFGAYHAFLVLRICSSTPSHNVYSCFLNMCSGYLSKGCFCQNKPLRHQSSWVVLRQLKKSIVHAEFTVG